MELQNVALSGTFDNKKVTFDIFSQK